MLSRIALRSALTLAAALPPRVSRTVARALAMIQYGCSGARRRAVLENLAWIGAAGHPRLKRREDRDRVARAIFESYQRFLLEFLSQGRAFRPEAVVPVGFSGMDTLYRAVGRGRGAIVVAPHVGNWEWGALALARLGFRVHAVTGVQLHAALAPAVRSLKERQGIAVHTPSDGFAPLVTALRRGGLVLLLADGDVRSRSVAVPFFGRMVGMPVGPALLARRTQAPIVHAHARRQSSGAVEVVIDGLDRADRSLPLDADIRRLTERIAAAAEATIARHVTQWCIFRPIFGSTEAAVAPGAPPRRNAA